MSLLRNLKLPILSLLLASAFSAGFAQGYWTIQMGAFTDYREATASVNQFKAQGFDSYSEFYMKDGKQLVRVRLGCFDTKETAELYANHMGLTNLALLPMSENAPVSHCVSRKIGAILPNRWGVYQSNASQAEFYVELQNQNAYLNFDGSSWNLKESSTALSETLLQESFYFREDAGLIKLFYPELSILTLTSGKLVWQQNLSAVIVEDNNLVAYTVSLKNED